MTRAVLSQLWNFIVKRWLLLLLLSPFVLAIGITIVGIAFCVGGPRYYSGKYEPPASMQSPTTERVPLRPQQQTEPHTCGFHAVSSIYEAYGLDSEAASLRFRLGTDKRLTNFDSESIGTIHPDIMRVMDQDGFEVELLSPGSSDASTRLDEHLRAGHVALALVVVKDYHWVVIDRIDAGNYTICDSLQAEPYTEPAAAYLENRVKSLLLVRVAEPTREPQ